MNAYNSQNFSALVSDLQTIVQSIYDPVKANTSGDPSKPLEENPLETELRSSIVLPDAQIDAYINRSSGTMREMFEGAKKNQAFVHVLRDPLSKIAPAHTVERFEDTVSLLSETAGTRRDPFRNPGWESVKDALQGLENVEKVFILEAARFIAATQTQTAIVATAIGQPDQALAGHFQTAAQGATERVAEYLSFRVEQTALYTKKVSEYLESRNIDPVNLTTLVAGTAAWMQEADARKTLTGIDYMRAAV